MIKWLGAIAAMAGVVACSAAASEQNSGAIPRVGSWDLSYDAKSCDLVGVFGKGRDQITLRMSRYEPGDSFALRVIGRKFASSNRSSEVALDFGPTVKRKQLTALNGRFDEMPMMILSIVRLDDYEPIDENSLPPPIPASASAAVTELTIKLGLASTKLQLGSLAAPMAALDRCTDDMVREWGLDPQQQRLLSQRVRPLSSPGDWVKTVDYPRKFPSDSALVAFRLGVDEDGRATQCHILSTAGEADFRKATCDALLSRACFSRALDVDGKPVKSYYINHVRWLAWDPKRD